MPFSGGNGTVEDPYLISTAEDLDNVRNYLSAYYLQMADIDLVDYNNWEPIANGEEYYFLGGYDGNNFKIKNLYINRANNDYTGLFSKLGGVPLHNSKNNYIKNCHVYGVVKGRNVVGGLCGSSTMESGYSNNLFYNCSFRGSVEGNRDVGGLVGRMLNPMRYCCSETDVHAISDVCGGLIGNMINFGGMNPDLKFCYSNSNVSGRSVVGGLIGKAEYLPIIEHCYSKGDVYFDSLYSGRSGGLIGESTSFLISKCYSSCSIDAPSNVINYGRGLVGRYNGSSYSVDCYHQSMNDDYSILKTIAQLKQQETFIDWDFNTVWGINPGINDGYPYLRWAFSGDINIWVRTLPTEIKKVIKMMIIDTPTTVKEIKKLNIITDTGLK